VRSVPHEHVPGPTKNSPGSATARSGKSVTYRSEE
jgi:hypothetical protein